MRRYPFMNNNGCQICFILLPNLLVWTEKKNNIQKLVTHVTHCLSGVYYLFVCYIRWRRVVSKPRASPGRAKSRRPPELGYGPIQPLEWIRNFGHLSFDGIIFWLVSIIKNNTKTSFSPKMHIGPFGFKPLRLTSRFKNNFLILPILPGDGVHSDVVICSPMKPRTGTYWTVWL